MLAVATHPVEAASTRYRVLAYVPFLEQHGVEVEFHPFFPSESLNALYRPGGFSSKLRYILAGTLERARRLVRGGFDVLLVHRELFPLGRTLLLRQARKRSTRIIYDYDDAMFLPQRSDRPWLRRLEDPDGTNRVIEASRAVIAGNAHLLEYATRRGARGVVIPTVVDTNRFLPRDPDKHGGKCVVGWVGSHSTEKFVRGLSAVFCELARATSYTLKIVGATRPVSVDGVEVIQRAWRLDTEADEFRTCDIGVYPLWDDEWGKGKCGFKAIQFMAAGVPVVASPTGTNREIIRDGVNGFFASTEAEWYEKLSLLIADPALRAQLGVAGRRTVEAHYSLTTNAPKFLQVVRSVAER